MKFNARETATILAALRNWQATVPTEDRSNWPQICDTGTPLNNQEINALAEKINAPPIRFDELVADFPELNEWMDHKIGKALNPVLKKIRDTRAMIGGT